MVSATSDGVPPFYAVYNPAPPSHLVHAAYYTPINASAWAAVVMIGKGLVR